MLYFDYSATTFPSLKVLKDFNYAAKNYLGNPNSSHKLGISAKKRIDEASMSIANILSVKPSEIIYVSGSSEANNLAIKGICKANKGKHIITTKLEHSSVIAPISRLCDEGYEVSFVNLNSDGTVDINHLKSLIREDTLLVAIAAVDSELGIKQNIEEIGMLLKNYPNVYFHVDATQLIGKDTFNFDSVDTFSFSAHKFFGIKGIGCLVKKENVRLSPQIDGGSSTTKFRSGTPTLELIVSLETALKEANYNLLNKINYVKDLNLDLINFLKQYDDIKINSTDKSIGQIINFSVPNSSKLVEMLYDCGIYLSTKSACSSADALSKSIMAVYDDKNRAENSIRISISYITTKKEIKQLKKIFSTCYKRCDVTYENN